MGIYLCVNVCMWVSVMKAAMCVLYAVRVPFLINVDITIKLHKSSTINRWINNDNLHATNVWQMPSYSFRRRPPRFVSAKLRLFSFVSINQFYTHDWIFIKILVFFLSLSLSLYNPYVRHKYANTRRDKNATVICDIIILPYFDILVINSF